MTSHSPNFASAARVERLTVLARPTPDAGVVARSPAEFGLTERQLGHLLRLLDVTKASLLFARGVVLVEGVAEQLLVPAFAQSLDRPLSRSGVAVINIGGVAFPPFAELFGPDKLPYRCAVVSDETRRSGPTPRSRRTLTRGCPPWPPRCGRARATTCSSYHGRTNLTMTMTAKNMPYKHGFGPFAGEIYRAPISYPFRDGGIGGLEAAKRAIALMDKQVSAENLAALVIEPIQGEGGFIVPAPGFLATLANWCRQSGVVFVADEVQSGMAYRGDVRLRARGRRARPGRVRQGPGRRAAAVRSDRRAEIMDAAHVGGLGGTCGGNPLACGAALPVFVTIREEGLLDRAAEIEKTMKERLTALQTADPRVGEVRGRGAMVAVEIVRHDRARPKGGLRFSPDVASTRFARWRCG